MTLIFNRFDFTMMSEIGGWTAGILGFSQFLLIPFGMGLIASYFWLDTLRSPAAEAATGTEPQQARVPRFKKAVSVGFTFANTLLACGGAYFILREGSICLLMASPLLCLFMWLGVLAGDTFWRRNPFLSASLVPLFLLLVFTEANRAAPPVFSVSTQFHSHASPAALWRYTADYPRNPHPPAWWLYQIGLPMPMQSKGAAQVGGRRDCLLSGGVDIGERIVVADTNRRLEFVIDRQPQHPEIVHHFILLRGRIDLRPDAQGGTWLRGTSWYRLQVTPASYFGLWSDAVVHQTHLRVFAWMDELALK